MIVYRVGHIAERGAIGRRQERTTKRATDARLWENNPIIPIWDHVQGKWIIPHV